jgi:CrcB protein
MIKDLLWVGIGGFAGSVARYLTNIGLVGWNWTIPWPTFMINVGGSLFIGILMAISYKEHQYWRLLLATGFCGGFTTFSTFSYENLKLWQEGQIIISLTYIFLSVLGGFAGVLIGFYITQKLVG